MECLDAPGIASTRRQASGGEAVAVADGVPEVLRGDDSDAMPDRQERRAVDLPIVVMESMTSHVFTIGRAPAEPRVVLNRANPEVGVWMLRPTWGIEPSEGGLG